MKIFIRYIYEILYFLLFIPFFSLISIKRGYKINFKDRLLPSKDKKDKSYIWFHCASVGELNLVKPLVENLKDEENILISVFSPRGLEYGKRVYPYAKVLSLPFDLTISIKRFLKNYNIKLGLIVEEEFWFNLITYSSKKFPIISINSRVSKNSYKRYKKFYFFYKYIFNSFNKFLIRSEKDYQLFKKLIKDSRKLKVCGDLKYISSINKVEINIDKANKKVLILASSHKGEEKLVIDIFKKLKSIYPNLALIIAPRHLERVEEIKNLLDKEGLSYNLRTETDKLEKDIYILNTLGELSGVYKYGDVVIMGGTFVDVGGHNILEPLYFNKPVILGRFTHKIDDLVENFKDTGLIKIALTEEDLLNSIKECINANKKINTKLEEKGKEILNCYINEIKKAIS